LIAGRLAATFATGVLADALSVSVDEGRVMVSRRVYGGAAVRTEQCLSGPAVVTVGAGVFTVPEGTADGNGVIVAINDVPAENKIKCVGKYKKQGDSVDLSAAKRVVGVGRGFAGRDDIKLAQELALALEAEVGCTRPIGEGENWLPRETYLGVTGTIIKPKLYLALGISGQVQHMVGVNAAQTIVAVNKDKNAPIFKEADYGIVGDLYKVAPGLTKLFTAAKQADS
jgi:electron transfer flavoprotein alpha subunit